MCFKIILALLKDATTVSQNKQFSAIDIGNVMFFPE